MAASLHISPPLIFKLSNSSSGVCNFYSLKYWHSQRCGHERKQKPSFSQTTISVSAVASTTTVISEPARRKFGIEAEEDPISLLNERIRRDYSKREASSSRPAMDSEEADKYIKMVKEQQQRGLQKLKGGGKGKEGGAFSYKVDPYTLRSGDYVVHKKVGIGRFVGIRFDAPKSSSESVEYVFIEYADGMAKLPLKQASRLLYRYCLIGIEIWFELIYAIC